MRVIKDLAGNLHQISASKEYCDESRTPCEFLIGELTNQMFIPIRIVGFEPWRAIRNFCSVYASAIIDCVKEVDLNARPRRCNQCRESEWEVKKAISAEE